MATFNDLYNYVMPYLPGAEPGIVDFHIRRALREFFKRTTVWRETFQFNTVANEATYQLIPTDGAVASVLEVYISERFVHAVPEDRRSEFAAAGTASGWHQLLPHVVTLYPTPAAVVPVRIVAALMVPVDPAARTFPTTVLEQHAEAIAAGAISGMMMMPGKPWTHKDSAATYSRIFGSAIRELRGMLRDGGQPNQSTFVGVRRFGV